MHKFETSSYITKENIENDDFDDGSSSDSNKPG